MTQYRFTSRAFQPPTPGGLDDECLQLMVALSGNPVLERVGVQYTLAPPTVDIEAFVCAKGTSKMAIAMAIDAAEYEWRAALGSAGLANRTVNTQLSRA